MTTYAEKLVGKRVVSASHECGIIGNIYDECLILSFDDGTVLRCSSLTKGYSLNIKIVETA